VLGWPSTPNLGDVPGALKAYRKAQAAQERLLAREPDNADLLRDLSTTLQRISRALFWAGEPRRGEEEARKAAVIEEGLSASDHGPVQAFRLARSYGNHGFLLHVSGRTVDSLKTLREGVAILERLSAADPANAEVKGRLAVTYGYLAAALWEGRPVPGVVPDFKAALEVQRKVAAIDGPLAAAAPSDPALQRQAFVSTMQLAQLHEHLHDHAAAHDHYRRGLARAEQFAAADAANVQAQKDLAWANMRMGTFLARTGAPDEALVLLRRAADGLKPLLAADPANVNTSSILAGNTEGFGHAHAAFGLDRRRPREERRHHWREARARFQEAYVYWTDVRDRGIALGSDALRPEALATEVAKCDAALAAAPR
jgi:tetratricopeptide (TPR) repeat protein